MNDRYLWDKTGADAEIERLENALAAFRSEQTSAPVLDAEISSAKTKRSSRQPFVLKFAAAACLLFATIAASAWFFPANNEKQVESDSAQTIELGDETRIARRTGDETQKSALAAETQNRANSNGSDSVLSAKRNAAFKRKTLPTTSRRRKTTAAKTPAEKQNFERNEFGLTAEEQSAYDQLVLALSITGAKLKIVKDKIGGSD